LKKEKKNIYIYIYSYRVPLIFSYGVNAFSETKYEG